MVAAPGVRPAHLLRRVGRLVLRPWRRGWRRTIKDVAWELDQIRVRRRLWRTSAGQRDLLRRELMRDEPRRRAECVFTLTLGSRRIAHRDNQLERFLRSFLAMTERPERAEILVKVDDDDDLEFFLRVKRRYARDVDLRFLVGERGRGYADLHKYQAALLALRNPASRICILLSEDAEFVLPKWDTEFLSRWDKLPHDCFIGADCPFEEAIAILGPYSLPPHQIYWVRGSLFPVLGFELLACLDEVARKYPGWTCLGNTLLMHCFSGDILRQLWLRHRVNLHLQTPVFVVERSTVGWLGNPERHNLHIENNLAFFFEENQQVRNEMADAVYRYLAGQGRLDPSASGAVTDAVRL